MQNILKVVGGAVAVLIIIDMLGFGVWIVSGQHPVDDFYIGTLTAHVLRALFF